MPVLADLTPFPSFGPSDAFLAVGWLGADGGHETGPTEPAVYRALVRLNADRWQPIVSAGVHHCPFCQFDPAGMTGELIVPGDGCIYVAPTGILHFIAVHWYRPPAAFCAAALACPPMRGMGYKRALLANGGRAMLRPPPS